MVGNIDTHDGEDGFSAIELPRTIKGRRGRYSQGPLFFSMMGQGISSTSAAPQTRHILPLGRASSDGSRGDPILQVRQ
jgi:hypothetical protein